MKEKEEKVMAKTKSNISNTRRCKPKTEDARFATYLDEWWSQVDKRILWCYERKPKGGTGSRREMGDKETMMLEIYKCYSQAMRKGNDHNRLAICRWEVNGRSCGYK